MNEPRRLNQGGGYHELLVRSASLDRTPEDARRRAVHLASTIGAFSSTSVDSGVRRKPASLATVLVKWIAIGAAAGGLLALGASQLLSSATKSAVNPADTLAELPAPSAIVLAPSRDIAAEPAAAAAPVRSATAQLAPKAGGSIEPWIPSPLPVVSAAAPAHTPSAAKFAEAQQIEAARDAVSRGNESEAIAALNNYEQAHPNGSLASEAMALRIQALANSGKTGEAKTLAKEFQNKYPAHRLSGQLENGTPTSRPTLGGGAGTPK